MKKLISMAIMIAFIFTFSACYTHLDSPSRTDVIEHTAETYETSSTHPDTFTYVAKTSPTILFIDSNTVDQQRGNTLHWVAPERRATITPLPLYVRNVRPSWAQRRLKRQIRRDIRRKRYSHHFANQHKVKAKQHKKKKKNKKKKK